MKKSLIIVALVVFGSAFAKAQSPREVSITNFDTVKVFDLITVNLVKSDTPKLVISGKDSEHVEFVQKGKLLKIRMETDYIFNGEDTFVYLHYTDLSTIDANEGSVILSNELIDQPELEIKVQEGARVTAGLSIKNLDVRAVTGGIVELNGISKFQDVVVNTGGIVENAQLKTQHSKVKVQAGGEVEIYASNSVEVSVRAGGDVVVYGNPSKVDKKTFMGGSVMIMD
ncbi:MAG: head GIN domain-containing protein [Nonlabens sp.]